MSFAKTYVVLEPVSRLLTARIPRLQRCLDDHHVANMVQDQQLEYKTHGCFSMVQSITIAVLSGDRFILDGQHRAAAYGQLQTLGYPIHEAIIPVVVYNAVSKEELCDYYNRINKHMPIHPFEKDAAWEDFGKTFCELFQRHYGTYLKPARGCRCPHISSDELKNHLQARNINNKLISLGKSVHDLWACVIELNSYMYNKANDQMCPNMRKRLQDCEAKATRLRCETCYLGAWRHFEWLDIAFYKLEHPHEVLSLSVFSDTQARTRVPAVMREQVWKKHNKNTCDTGECFVCRRALRFCDMECGHIVAHALGGATTTDNLMPVCKTCNRDMGIMNLMHYKNMLESVAIGDMDIN